MSDYTITPVTPNNTYMQKQIRSLLQRTGITQDRNLDYTCAMTDEDGYVIATGSCFGNTLRCLAVDPSHQGENLLGDIVSHLVSNRFAKGITHLFVYTKTTAAPLLTHLGFYEITRIDNTMVFMENRKNGFSSWVNSLETTDTDTAAIVMNANPFTKGHLHLLETACKAYPAVHLFLVREDLSEFPYTVRKQLVSDSIKHLPNVILHDCGPYMISQATFPSYFLKDEETAAKNHAILDVSIFTVIAETLHIKARYVGEEPNSPTTSLYNRTMQELLPQHHIACHIIPRLETDGMIISASTVRKALREKDWDTVKKLVPSPIYSYLSSPEAEPIIASLH